VSETILVQVAGIIIIGVAAQWLAWRLRLPSILLLLLLGFVAGPFTGFLDPGELFGDLLLPVVSMCVALILFEGGLSLRVADLPAVGGIVRNLVSLGALITWAVGALAAYWIFGLPGELAVLLGAILVVTGPTVVGPLLRHIRPVGTAGPILRWEGIVIDPIGALLAVLVFEVILSGSVQPMSIALAVARTVVIGGGLGLLAAALLTLLLARHAIPDFLQNAASLMLVLAVFTASNHFQQESGLLAVTVMGIALANQKFVDVRHIVEFKENLRVLLIASLFILLAARLPRADLARVGVAEVIFVAVLVLVARPLAVAACTLGSRLTFKERVFLAWVAPRGVVAAAVSSVFALRLQDLGYEGAALLVPITFIAIIGTVAIYGLTSGWVARRLGVADPNPQGVLLVGAQSWARLIAAALKEKGYAVCLVDSNRENIAAARMAGLPTYADSILAEYAIEEIYLGGIGRILAMTPNDWVNVLAVQRFRPVFGRAQCFQLSPRKDPAHKKERHKHLHGRWLFGEAVTYATLSQRFAAGATVKTTKLSKSFDYQAFRDMYGESAVPLFVISEKGTLSVVTADQPIVPTPGQTLISLVSEPSGNDHQSGSVR
jgi:NhaP-type Na+/H+ or K+/H+ antiporter